MRRFIDLPTKKKLLSVFALLAALMLIIIAVASWLLLSFAKRQERLYEEDLKIALYLEHVETQFHRTRSILIDMMFADRDYNDGTAEIESIVRGVMEDLAELDRKIADRPQLQQLYREFREIYDAFRETRRTEIFPALREGRKQDALKTLTGIQDQRYDRIYALAEQMIDIARDEAEEAVARAMVNAYQAVAGFTTLGIAAVLLIIFLVAKLTRMITEPLSRIGGFAREVADGNLTIEVRTEPREDEFGRLGTDFSRMVGNLRELNREILEGINVLASSGSQILAATSQMASGAAETATAVNETTVTVEEVKQTAHLATEKSQHVAEIAQRAVQGSQAGQGAVDEAVEGMRQIMGQMEVVTDSIVRLSELGQAIGEIIATVNDLAEQSNLLAVNAAIEASKAGEHGKGFAVVAQEVRHLAVQSKQATAQVRNLLGDIQKATSASVMATEQGTKAVEAGVRQSTRAGETIRTLAETVEEAATAALQIAASSKEQLVGMDQIALAMQNIKTATSQHVAGTKQTEEASMRLHELGNRLQKLASRFRV